MDEAQRVAESAASMDPSGAGSYDLGAFYALRGDRDRAMRYLRQSVELGIDVTGVWPSADADLVSLRDDPEFQEYLGEAWREELAKRREAVANEPDSWRTLHDLGDALGAINKWDEAAAAFEKGCELTETQDPCAHLAYALHRLGRTEEAGEVARHASEREDEDWSTYHLACYFALAGYREAAIDHLRRSLELGYWDAEILVTTDLESLRGDPEFEALLATRTGRKR